MLNVDSFVVIQGMSFIQTLDTFTFTGSGVVTLHMLLEVCLAMECYLADITTQQFLVKRLYVEFLGLFTPEVYSLAITFRWIHLFLFYKMVFLTFVSFIQTTHLHLRTSDIIFYSQTRFCFCWYRDGSFS